MIRITKEPAFTRGDFYGLNHANKENPAFGRLDGETVSGHWLYAYLRRDHESGQTFMVVANFHGSASIESARIRVPEHALHWLGMTGCSTLEFSENLADGWVGRCDVGSLPGDGLALPTLPPLSARMMRLKC